MLSTFSYSFNQASSSIRTWLDGLRCTCSESRLIDCPVNTIGSEDCTHSDDVGVVCIGELNSYWVCINVHVYFYRNWRHAVGQPPW